MYEATMAQTARRMREKRNEKIPLVAGSNSWETITWKTKKKKTAN
jgi:hypothetical protein